MKLCIVAGEASGDLHASEVLRELRRDEPDLEVFGLGGDLLAAQGMTILHHVQELGIVGLFNVLRHLGMFRRVFKDLMNAIRSRRPDAVLLVDYPDFNLRVARECRELGVRVIYFISPQVWAWRTGRVRQIARDVDEMLVILPFEEDFYRRHGAAATYVGHPLVEQLEGFRESPKRFDPQRPLRLALLPGSRRMEVGTLLGPMLDAVKRLQTVMDLEAWIIKAPTIDLEVLDTIQRQAGTRLQVVADEGRRSLARADLALSSSGTATLECAMLDVPPVVMYRLTRATYALARWLVRLPDFCLVNIVAGRRVVPELIQQEVNGERIASEVRALLEPSRWAAVHEGLEEVRRRMGEPGASGRAARRILEVVRGKVRARDPQ